MCGIIGIVDTIGHTPPSAYLPVLRDAMQKRGPDGWGDFADGPVAMAMRRLAIIDLEQGGQPLTSLDGRVVAFQNGEIYNHQTLRLELATQGYLFSTNSDTEVLAHGYACWGIDGLLARVDGMFAIAILDRNRNELHVARDRFGEKPLFYCHAPGRFGYASDLLLLAALPWVGESYDPTALDQYLAVHYVAGPRTIYRNIHRVLPGERLCIPTGNPIPVATRYYLPPVGEKRHVCDDELADCLSQAVASRMIADVPVGIFLSGGLDSSVVATLAARTAPSIDTFSMGFSSAAHDESPYAKEVASILGSCHHHAVFEEVNFLDLIPQVAAAMDEPCGDQALLPLFQLSQSASQQVKVVLSGEGADELFGGYRYYASPTGWLARLRTHIHDTARRFVRNPAPITPAGFPLLADAALRTCLMSTPADSAPDVWESEMIVHLDQAATPLQRAQAADLATWLPDDLLVKLDRMAMAHSLEGRAPYLHPKLAALALALPDRDKLSGDDNKLALRRIARRWLPNSILSRPKQGFVLPMSTWLKQWFADFDGPATYFRNRVAPESLGLRSSQLIALAQAELEKTQCNERLLFALVMLLEWQRTATLRVSSLRSSLSKRGLT